jgi:excinuclease ABC subunit B
MKKVTKKPVEKLPPAGFKLVTQYEPSGDQPAAIQKLTKSLEDGNRYQTLLGVTGSGKTFTMAQIINNLQRPTLVMAHNKTLAAQLASEFQELFPNNAVQYFVSYYDYYQPEAYIPRSDTYIEKETEINEEIDRLRNAATQSLLTRRDVLIVASVSCIYGLGNPEKYAEVSIALEEGQEVKRDNLLRRLTDMQFSRNDIDLHRGTFRVRGELVEIVPAGSETILRLSFFGDTLEKISEHDPLTNEELNRFHATRIFPAKHFVTTNDTMQDAVENIRAELKERLTELRGQGKILEAARLEQRTNFDMETLLATGFVSGIENYSRHLDFRQPGAPAATLIDYFPEDFVLFVDESHMTIPQVRGMYGGDRSRKENLVNYGFRLPSAMDNRPLTYDEFESRINQAVFVTATPTAFEIDNSKVIAEQIIRPTGLLDPTIEIRPTKNQIDDLLAEIRKRTAKHQRVIATTLTKRMAEELTEYLKDLGIAVQYIHSEVDTFERLEILRDLRLGVYDVIVGINLLREGLDLPEVSLVAILDADKEGFLRSETAFMQVMGRAARHIEGHVIMYADKMTGSMDRSITETRRRRVLQEKYNTDHGITPQTITKAIHESRLAGTKKEIIDTEANAIDLQKMDKQQVRDYIHDLDEQMDMASRNLDFETAAKLRDAIQKIRDIQKLRK